jgi:uncharacterized protein
MEIFAIPVGEKIILYRPLAGLAFVGNRAMADLAMRLAQGSQPVGPDSVAGAAGFLSQIGFFEPDPPAPPDRPVDPDPALFQPVRAVLLLTNRCQLRCTYCYAAGGEHPRLDLSDELGEAAIDYVSEIALQRGLAKFDLAFHGGGEPTTAWSVMQACAAYARKKPLRAWISLMTNGIWSRSQLDWILAHVNELGISMDGSPTTQDHQRPFASGRSSSAWVLHNMAELDRRSFFYGVRMTATAPWESLPEDVRFLCQETGCRSIQVEPAFNAQRGSHSQAGEGETQRFMEAFLEAYEIASRSGRRLFCSSARLGVVANSFCTSPYDALIVNGSGDLVTCYEISAQTHPMSAISTIGRIEAGRVKIDGAQRARLHAAIAERRERCRPCFCYWSCAGDCYPRAYASGPDGHLFYGPRCEMNRTLVKEMLLRLIAEGGGVWRSAWRKAPASVIYAGHENDGGLG